MASMVVIDDNLEVASLIKMIVLEHLTHSIIQTATGGEEGLQLIEKYRPKIVLCDFQMPGMNGAKVARKVKERWPEMVFIGMSGTETRKDFVCADDFLRKPFGPKQLVEIIGKYLPKS